MSGRNPRHRCQTRNGVLGCHVRLRLRRSRFSSISILTFGGPAWNTRDPIGPDRLGSPQFSARRWCDPSRALEGRKRRPNDGTD